MEVVVPFKTERLLPILPPASNAQGVLVRTTHRPPIEIIALSMGITVRFSN